MTFIDGENVGPYRIITKLGQGGMATVYKAYHAALDRHVAIKVMHDAFREDPGFLARFTREAQIVAKLEHPNIVPIYDFSTHKGNPYLVMKFIDGETLKMRLKDRMLTLDEILHLMHGMGMALTYAHTHGILHRDIKPSNVILDTEGIPYLADFGLARIASAGASTLSQDMMLGTPQYISPEQARGDRDLGPGTDIYSMGVMLYELVVGRVPFNADTPYAIVHDHIFTPLPLPCIVNPDVPPEVEIVLLKALAKAPEDRYASAQALVEDFRKAVEDAALENVSPGLAAPIHDDTAPGAAPTETDRIVSPFETPPPVEGDTPPIPQKAVRLPPFEPAIPPVVDGVGSSAQHSTVPIARERNPHGNLWLMGGVGALVFTCLLFALGLAGAFNEDIPGSGPHSTLAPFIIEPPTLADFDLPQDRDAQQEMLVAAVRVADLAPYDAVAQFDAALLTLYVEPGAAEEDGGFGAVLGPFYRAASGDPVMLIAGMQELTAREFYKPAAWLAVRSMELYPENDLVRQEAGAYLWRFAAEGDVSGLALYGEEVARPSNPVMYVMYSRALIAKGSATQLRLAERQISRALEIDPALAEAHLALGLLYATAGEDLESARNELQFAITAPAPEAVVWVEAEARRLLDEYNLRGRSD